MQRWSEIRRRVLVEGVSQRQVLRESGLHWTTLKKVLTESAPPGYRMEQLRAKPKLGRYVDRIGEMLASDGGAPPKQRHTAQRIYARLVTEGYSGKYTVVKDAVREIRRVQQEVYMPLVHQPGEAQVDYCEALVRMRGVLRSVECFVMALPYSDAFLVQAFERECTESFWEGHARAFAYFESVPKRISYDNSKIAVKAIVGVHERELTDGFLQLTSHYLFAPHFCTVRRANEKGVVEGTVKYARQNFMVPVPQVRDFEELNTYLLSCCRSDLGRRLRGRGAIKAELLKEDQAAALPLPATAFEACRQRPTRSNSLSLVRFDGNDYSVPVRYAHHEVRVKGYVDRVVICCHDQVIAQHRRVWEKERTIFEPTHYLGLLERKPGALDHARPLLGLQLPECFAVLRRRLEADRNGAGTRDYITVLRLLERYSVRQLTAAVERSLRVAAPTPEVVRLYLIPDEPIEASVFRWEGRAHLRGVTVTEPELSRYHTLLSDVGAGGRTADGVRQPTGVGGQS